jgi:hypothetical protein
MMPRGVANELNKRDIVVVMAVDLDMMGSEDESHLKRAEEAQAVLVTLDRPFAGRTAKSGLQHSGLICWTGKSNDHGGLTRVLTAFADEYSLEQAANQVFWLS